MLTTEILPNGECRISDFPEKDNLTPASVYLWVAGAGWKKWINSESVEGGGYWRAFTDEQQLRVLDISMQQAIGALARRSGTAATDKDEAE